MKKFLFSLLTLGVITTSQAQSNSVIFEDSFETYTDFAISNVGNWTLTDVDQLATYAFEDIDFPFSYEKKSFQVFNPDKTSPPLSGADGTGWFARTGNKFMVSFACVDGINNDWIITPQINLGASDNVLKFYAKAADDRYGVEKFKVLVSTTDKNTASFTEIGRVTIDSDIEYAEYTYNLSAYNGKPVYIAIQGISNDQFGLIVDDFSVTGNVLGVSDTNVKEVSRVFPNPVNDAFQLELSPSFNTAKLAIEIIDLTGRKVAGFNSVAKEYNINSLPKGVYILRITDGQTKIVKKLVKN